MRHLLVTNDFPPKLGGIQSYLWELWRRLAPGEVTVMTTTQPGWAAFDAAQHFRVVRARHRVLLPTLALAQRVEALAAEVRADLVVIDPVVPLGTIGAWLKLPYAVVVHGAEVTVPGRLPGSRTLMGHTLRGAVLVIAAGTYAGVEAERVAGQKLPLVSIPPGVDGGRFRPLSPSRRAEVRRTWGIRPDARMVLGVGRLVPRKGFDVLVEAAVRLSPGRPDLVVALAGSGREGPWLARLAAGRRAPVRMLSKVDEDDLAPLYGAADLFASPCRTRWGGLEQEGFGIVFLEAAAAAVPAVAGASGGVAEAVVDGVTGVVVRHPDDPTAVANAIGGLVDDHQGCQEMGAAARQRALAEFSYDRGARRLAAGLDGALRAAPIKTPRRATIYHR